MINGKMILPCLSSLGKKSSIKSYSNFTCFSTKMESWLATRSLHAPQSGCTELIEWDHTVKNIFRLAYKKAQLVSCISLLSYSVIHDMKLVNIDDSPNNALEDVDPNNNK